MTGRSSALRRRRRPTLATRLKVFWVFIVASIAAAAYAGYAIVTLPQLRVHAVDVRLAGSAVTDLEVRRAAAIDRSANVWLLDTARIARRIELIPYVERADVQRRLPADLVITLRERTPAACVMDGSRSVTIDLAQRILQSGCPDASAIRIVLRERLAGRPGTFVALAPLAALLTDARALSDAHVNLRSIGNDRFGQLTGVSVGGITYYFGSDADLAQKAKLVAPVLAAARPGHVIRSIDVRSPSTPTVEFR